MSRFKLSARALCFVLIIAAAAICAALGFAPEEVGPAAYCQSSGCSFPACNREGESFNSETGNCESSSGFPTFTRSHRVPSCLDGERFDRATGNCILNVCDESGCEVRALCTRRGERYGRSGRDRDGVYGVCESRPNWLGHRSHRLVRCPYGSVLNEGRGVCVRCPTVVPVPVRRPDLVIRRAFLRLASSPVEVTNLRRGQNYLACFEVANVGAAASGPFRVEGGGLGVRTLPSQAHASLPPGAERVGCLLYSTTPPVGSYRLGITADSLRTVRETREDNNAATLTLNVVP